VVIDLTTFEIPFLVDLDLREGVYNAPSSRHFDE